MRSTSVVIPVKDGERYLPQILDALADQRPDQVLVIDSGSRDRSVELARAAGVDVLEIAPADFGHGRTRNLGVAETTGDLVCFLTQDAVPLPGWLDAFRAAFDIDEHVGAAYGPHLPREDTSPMIARELTEFFASMAPEGSPALHRAGDLEFLSNVNACYARECIEEIQFADVPYAEDQAFGATMLAQGWAKVYQPEARVLHAHDYPPVEFARRYFDEFRGLALTNGHVPDASPRAVARHVRHGVAGDRRWMTGRDYSPAERARWTVRSAFHHASRQAGELLGSRHDRLPASVQQALSLERRASAPAALTAPPERAPAGRPVPAHASTQYNEILSVTRSGPAPLLEPVKGRHTRDRLHLAFLLPPFKRGSGGHNTICQTIRRLEDMGHTCTIWMHDPEGRNEGRWASVLRREIREWFAPVRAPVFTDFEGWHGADVAVATGWETAHATAALPGCAARAYLVNDHEPEFFGTSAEGMWAQDTYSLGLFPISASPWLRDLVAERYGSEGTAFRLGVDHSIYRPDQVERRRDTVIVYARSTTPRRAVPLALLALEELTRRLPDTRVVLFGQADRMRTNYPYELLGVATPGQLALNFCEATVGLCLSLTNYSLIPQEMMACGLPCVDIAGGSSEAVFGSDGPVELATADPVALADAMEALLTDQERWDRRSDAGLLFVADADWDVAARQIEGGLREALRVVEETGKQGR